MSVTMCRVLIYSHDDLAASCDLITRSHDLNGGWVGWCGSICSQHCPCRAVGEMLLPAEQAGRLAAFSLSLFVTFSRLTHHSSRSALQSINLSICLQNKLLASAFLFSSDARRLHLYFPFFMWTQYTPSVARKPYEHFFFPPGADV